MRLLLAANNQATRRNEIIKTRRSQRPGIPEQLIHQLGSSSNRYAPRLPQQETKSSTKQLPPTDPILGPENLLKTGFAQKGLPSVPFHGRHHIFSKSFIETKRFHVAIWRVATVDTKQTSKNEPLWRGAKVNTKGLEVPVKGHDPPDLAVFNPESEHRVNPRSHARSWPPCPGKG